MTGSVYDLRMNGNETLRLMLRLLHTKSQYPQPIHPTRTYGHVFLHAHIGLFTTDVRAGCTGRVLAL